MDNGSIVPYHAPALDGRGHRGASASGLLATAV